LIVSDERFAPSHLLVDARRYPLIVRYRLCRRRRHHPYMKTRRPPVYQTPDGDKQLHLVSNESKFQRFAEYSFAFLWTGVTEGGATS